MRSAGVALALTLGIALSGCSSSGSADTAGDSAGDAAAVDAAKTKVAEYSSAEQDFPMPTEAFDPGKHSAAVIAMGSAAAVVQENAQHAVDAFKSMDWTVSGPLDGEFSPPVTGGLIESAVEQGVDAIVMVSVNVEDASESVQKALDAGVAVSCVMCPENGDFADAGVMYATIDFKAQGEILGWAMIDQSDGAGTILSSDDPGSRATVARADGVRKTVEENCPECTILDDLAIPSADGSKPGPPQWSAFLNANPSGVSDVASMADVVGVPMAKTLMDVGRTDIRMYGYDADPEAIDMIRQGDTPYTGTVALPYHWADWAAVDLVARQVAGASTWDASTLPMRLITADNVDDFTEFAPAGDWQNEFKTLWGVA